MKKETPETKKLYRSRQDKMIGGVCGGIAEYFNIDPVWVRLIAVLLVFADGIGIILYILAWILVPENPSQKESKKTVAEETVEKVKTAKAEKTVKKTGNATIVLGIILVSIGGALLMKNLFSWFSFRYVWPMVIIAFGVYLLARRTK